MAQRLWRRPVSDSESCLSKDQIDLQRAFNELPIKDRVILAMRHFERLSNKEIAQALGLAEATVSNRYWQALQRIVPNKEHISA